LEFFLLVPLGDVLDRRTLIPGVLFLSALMLMFAALSPTFSVLLAALAAVGLTTVSAQLLTPLASELADHDRRGRVVGTISAGALTGILLSRTVSGIVSDLMGWRAIYGIAAVLALTMAIILRRILPALPKRARVPYLRLLASVFETVTQHNAVPGTLLISASTFAVFSLFWTSLTYLLSSPPFSYSTSQIGLFGLAGLVGALGARRAGILHDRGWSVPATGAATVLLAVSLIGAWASQSSLGGILIVIVALDLAVQSTLVLGQARLMSLPGNAGSRLNTAYVVSNFMAAAAGSALSGPLWDAGGWSAIAATGLGINLFAFVVWVLSRRRLETS
jgi:predicted MFS family arabinose efflux permease